MIELTLTTALTLYLLFSIGSVLAIWAYAHYKKGKRKLISLPKKLLVCEFCHTPFLEGVDKKVSPCPECGLWNNTNSTLDK